MPDEPAPAVLARAGELLRDLPDDRGGALWRLAADGRQLDANLVRLAPGTAVAPHVEPDLDVLLLVTAGAGELTGTGERLEPGGVVWLPRGSRRGLSAGPDGLAYLTVHRRRPGMTIRPPAAGPEGGETACQLHRVCPECGRMAESSDARHCARCGTGLPAGY